MTIPEDVIMNHLNWHLTQSEPGAQIHHLSVLFAPAGAVTALGLIDETKICTDLVAIVPPDSARATEEMITNVARTLIADAVNTGNVIVFASLSQEMWSAPMDELGQQLLAQGLLEKHPDAVEVTAIYGACRDGRRWCGRRYLTGPQAGEIEDVELLVGHPQRGESQGIRAERLIRQMVGIG